MFCGIPRGLVIWLGDCPVKQLELYMSIFSIFLIVAVIWADLLGTCGDGMEEY